MGRRRTSWFLLPLLLLLLPCSFHSIASAAPLEDTSSFGVGAEQWLRFLKSRYRGNDEGNGNEGNGGGNRKWQSQGEDKDFEEESEGGRSDDEESDEDEQEEDDGSGNVGDDMPPARPLPTARPTTLRPTTPPTPRPNPAFLTENTPAPTAASSSVRVVAALTLDLSPIPPSNGAMDANALGRFEAACETFLSDSLPSSVADATCRVRSQWVLPLPSDGTGGRRRRERGRNLANRALAAAATEGVDAIDEAGAQGAALLRVGVRVGGTVQAQASSTFDFWGVVVELFELRGEVILSLIKDEEKKATVSDAAAVEVGGSSSYFDDVETVQVVVDGSAGTVHGASRTSWDAASDGVSRGVAIFLAVLAVLVAAALLRIGFILQQRRREAYERACAAAPRMRPKPSSGAPSTRRNFHITWGNRSRRDEFLAPTPPSSPGSDGQANSERDSFHDNEPWLRAKPEAVADCGIGSLGCAGARAKPLSHPPGSDSVAPPGTQIPAEASAVPPSLARDGPGSSVPPFTLSALASTVADPKAFSALPAHHAASPSAPDDKGADAVSMSFPSAVPSFQTYGDNSTALGAPWSYSVAAVTVDSPVPVPRDQRSSVAGSVPRWLSDGWASEEGRPYGEGAPGDARRSDGGLGCDPDVDAHVGKGWRRKLSALAEGLGAKTERPLT